MKTIYWKILNKFYSLIRPLFVQNISLYEDFGCIYCGKPLLKRYLYCSDKCEDLDEDFQLKSYGMTNNSLRELIFIAHKHGKLIKLNLPDYL